MEEQGGGGGNTRRKPLHAFHCTALPSGVRRVHHAAVRLKTRTVCYRSVQILSAEIRTTTNGTQHNERYPKRVFEHMRFN